MLGPLRVVRDDGSVIDLPRRMERRLLAALAAHHPRPVSMDELVDVLWGGVPPGSARKTLQTNALRIRHALGNDSIVTTPDGYRLGDGVRVDVDDFERSGDLALWRGEPFADLADWEAVEGRRARLAELHRRSEDTAAESLLATGQPASAVADLERLVADDPARELRWTLLVRALAARDAGRRRCGRTSGPAASWPPNWVRPAPSWRRRTAPPSATPACRSPATTRSSRSIGCSPPARAWPARATAAAPRPRSSGRPAWRGRRGTSGASPTPPSAPPATASGRPRRHRRSRLARSRGAGPRPARPDAVPLRLLARLSVLQSQNTAPGDNEPPARTALAIARTLDDPALVAGALTAITIAVADPLRHAERRCGSPSSTPSPPITPTSPGGGGPSRWTPASASSPVTSPARSAVFAELDTAAIAVHDVVGHHAASYGEVLAATVAGDWHGARVAAARVRRTSSEAMFDDGTAIIGELGMLGIIALLEGAPPAPILDIEWPTPEMEAAMHTYVADSRARCGLHDERDRCSTSSAARPP